MGRIKKGLTATKLYGLVDIFGPKLGVSLQFKLPNSKVFLNKELQQQIQKMRLTAANYRMAYLTASQVQSLHRMFVINKNIHPQFRLETNTHAIFNKPQDYNVFINPQIVKGDNMEEKEQTCLIFPFVKFIVPRYKNITLKFRDQLKNYRTEEYQGSVSQLLQHCINHLDGELLLDYSLSKGRFYMQKECASYYPKTSFLMRQYSYRLKAYETSTDKTAEKTEQFIKMKEDYLQRLKNQYQKESIIYSQKLSRNEINLF